jgi:predicted ferric reductase
MIGMFALLVVIVETVYYNFMYFEWDWSWFTSWNWEYIGLLIAFCMFPIFMLWLLPIAKHSIWTPICGLSFEAGIKWHKWMGAFLVVAAGLHGACMIIYYAVNNEFSEIFTTSGYYPKLYGVIALGFFLLIGMLSFEQIRKNNYNLFRIGHLMTIPAVVFAYMHASRMLKYYVWGGIVLLLIDYAFIVLSGLLLPTQVLDFETFELDSVSDRKKKFIVLRIKRTLINCKIGQFVWIWIPAVSLFAHPFSVMNILSSDGAFSLLIQVQERSNRKTFTSALYDILSRPNASMPYSVAIGAFGKLSISPFNYKKCILIAGGSGITSVLPICRQLLDSGDRRETQLHWSLQTPQLYEKLKNYIHPDGFSSIVSSFRVTLYDTSSNSNRSQVELQSINVTSGASSTSSSSSFIPSPYGTDFSLQKEPGRPLLSKILFDAHDQCTESSIPALSVFVSGPESLISDTKFYISRINQSKVKVHLHTFQYHF